jgi:hypothetical protein
MGANETSVAMDLQMPSTSHIFPTSSKSVPHSARVACPECAEVDPSPGRQLAVEQRGDEEAAEDEENVDTDEATGQEREAGVVREYREDGQGADTVERA